MFVSAPLYISMFSKDHELLSREIIQQLGGSQYTNDYILNLVCQENNNKMFVANFHYDEKLSKDRNRSITVYTFTNNLTVSIKTVKIDFIGKIVIINENSTEKIAIKLN